METMAKTPSNRHIRILKNSFEKSLWERKKLVVGIDEVGRGCLAGPLVTSAAILPIGKVSPLLKDSKTLDVEGKKRAFAWISRHCRYQVGIVHNRLIDEKNIHQATFLAMKRALLGLIGQIEELPGAILIDAMPLNIDDTGLSGIPVYHFTKGESKSSSIAAASIVAKIVRDQLMSEYEKLFPGYKLAQHMGYATKTHQGCIAKAGHSIIHRKSFLKAILDINPKDKSNQLSCT